MPPTVYTRYVGVYTGLCTIAKRNNASIKLAYSQHTQSNNIFHSCETRLHDGNVSQNMINVRVVYSGLQVINS